METQVRARRNLKSNGKEVVEGPGNLDQAALLKHVSENKLVGWAWAPGGKRMPAPGTQAGFGALMRAWFESGAVCPAD